MHNARMWAEKNPHGIRHRSAQTRFFVNAWAGIIVDHFIGSCLLTFRLTGRNYLLFLQQLLPQLLRNEQISEPTKQTIGVPT